MSASSNKEGMVRTGTARPFEHEDTEPEPEGPNSQVPADARNALNAGEFGDERPPVRILLLAFMFMFQGYGVMNGNPQHALKEKLQIGHDGYAGSAEFQDATAVFQLFKYLMRIFQISLLVFFQLKGIVYFAYFVMFVAVSVPVVFVWCAGVTDLWVVYLQYSLGGIAIGFFEGTFLSVISSLGKNTKTYVIMGAPLGFAVHNIVLGTVQPLTGMPTVLYYVYTLCCLPVALWIFHVYAPAPAADASGKGCQVFLRSMRKFSEWLPIMVPWLVAKFIGNFVMEDAFPLLFNTFSPPKVPLWLPSDTEPTIPFQYYTADYWFVLMAIGDTVSRRVPHYIGSRFSGSWSGRMWWLPWIFISILLCVGGEALNFLLIPIVTGLAAFISYFGNGLVYGLSAKFIDGHIAKEHQYTAYNLWCFCGDLGGYAGQSSVSVWIAGLTCKGRHYTYVCKAKEALSMSRQTKVTAQNTILM